MNTYFINKQGVHSQGIMWIGEDIEEGRSIADFLASHKNEDGYHAYDLCLYKPPKYSSLDWKDRCECIYTGVNSNKTKEEKLKDE